MKVVEEFIRANLDPKTNGAGRPLTEYTLRVEVVLPDGVLGLHLVPVGFEARELVVGIIGSTLTSSDALEAAVKDLAAVREAERIANDERHAAAVQAQYDRQAEVEAKFVAERAEEEAKARPLDIAAAHVETEPAA